MSSTSSCRCVVVGGVAGVGKSTLAPLLAQRLHWEHADGDTFHPQRNVAKMSAGVPLDDTDRTVWLAAIGAWIDEHSPRSGTVVACSALRRSHRDQLTAGRPWLRFCQLTAPREVLHQRLSTRKAHFMPASLLDSQLAALESLAPDEPGSIIDATQPAAAMLTAAVEALDLGPAP